MLDSHRTMMPTITFLQISDVHLDSACTDLSWEAAQRHLRQALSASIDAAKHEAVDVILVPGDVYEHENETAGTASFLAEEFERAKPIPIVIAPGNHDFFAAGTLWQRTHWPDNVRIFSQCRISSIELQALGLRIYGFAHESPEPCPDLISGWRATAKEETSILLAHGSLIGAAFAKKEVTCPFTEQELAETGATYAAVGHYHGFKEMTSAGGDIIGAYSGCPAGRGFDETGEKAIILGEISGGKVRLRTKCVAHCSYRRLPIALEGAPSEAEVARAIAERLQGASAKEIIRVVLEGRVSKEFSTSRIAADQFDGPAKLELEWRAEPEYDIESIARKDTTEGLFVKQLLERLEKAAEEEKPLLRQAIYYGLDAFSGRSPEPRD